MCQRCRITAAVTKGKVWPGGVPGIAGISITGGSPSLLEELSACHSPDTRLKEKARCRCCGIQSTHFFYKPRYMISFHIKAFQGAVPNTHAKWLWDCNQCSLPVKKANTWWSVLPPLNQWRVLPQALTGCLFNVSLTESVFHLLLHRFLRAIAVLSLLFLHSA